MTANFFQDKNGLPAKPGEYELRMPANWDSFVLKNSKMGNAKNYRKTLFSNLSLHAYWKIEISDIEH